VGLIKNLFAPKAISVNEERAWSSWPGVGTSKAGVNVTPETGLGSSPVWGATRLLADSVAMLPIILYERLVAGGKERAETQPLFEVLHDSPNVSQTAYTWKRVTMVHAALWGNAYSLILPGPRGFADQLVPLHPDGVRVETIPGGYRYQLRQPDGTEKPVNREDVLHIRGLSLDGQTGMSVIRYARESIGINLAARDYGATFFKQGARPIGILRAPGVLTKEGRENIREYFMEQHSGSLNAHRPAVLQEGVEWQATGLTNEDAMLLETLAWSAADVARYFNVPLHMLQETSKVTSWGSGIAELSIGFVTYSLMPWLTNIQEQIGKDLILDKRKFFVEFLVDALLRGKTLERYQAYAVATGGAPWMAPNEVRERENLNAMDGLDEVAKPAAPAPPAPAEEPDPAQEEPSETETENE
jgi:HK97 family phage portal protein